MENPHFKIRSYTAKVCWVYNHPVPRWADAIADDEVKDLLKMDRQFKRFPNYRTFGENPPKLIDLSVRQVNMLAHLSGWIVDQKSDYIIRELDL